MLAASGFYNGKNMGKTMLMMVGKPKISWGRFFWIVSWLFFFGKPCGFSHPKSFIFPCGIFDHFWDCWFCETLHQGKLRRIATWRGCHDPIKHDKFLDRFTKLEYWISKNKQQKKVGDRMHRDYDKNTSNEGSPYTLLNFYTVNIIVCQFCIFETKNFCGKK